MSEEDKQAAPKALDAGEREKELRSLNRRRRVPRYRSLVMHWLGRALRRPARTAVQPLPSVDPGQVGVSFAGHASALIRYADLTVACDPMLGRWARGVKREVAPGLSPADLQDVDLILISHDHVDHLHRSTLKKLPRSATIVLPQQTAHRVSDLGFARVIELGIGQSVQHRRVDIATTAVRHGGPRDVNALSYVIRGDGPSVFFCGDSGYFSGFSEVGRRFRPDIALLPIGGYSPSSFRDRHMTPLDALYAFEDLQARVMIPIHYGSFALSYERLHDPGRWLAELIRTRELERFVIPLEPGSSEVFVPPRLKARPVTGADDDVVPDVEWVPVSESESHPSPDAEADEVETNEANAVSDDGSDPGSASGSAFDSRLAAQHKAEDPVPARVGPTILKTQGRSITQPVI